MNAVYYVISYNATITECGDGTPHPEPKLYYSAATAKDEADKLRQLYGNQRRVVKVETIWTTKTLADLKAERTF